jgi:hypothetical protein
MRGLIDCFLLQTNPNWELSIIYDGKAPQNIMDTMNLYNDSRIIFLESEQRNQQYGHPNRKMMLEKMETSSEDFVLMTNDDNYYVPVFVQYMLDQVRGAVGMVYCDSVHSHFKYIHHQTRIKVDHIDIGSFIVRIDIAKKVGFANFRFNADGYYAEACAMGCAKNRLSIKYISKPLFVHN